MFTFLAVVAWRGRLDEIARDKKFEGSAKSNFEKRYFYERMSPKEREDFLKEAGFDL
jgi:hypothetical protein